ncbi:hypothetical protein ACH4TX_42060 [Streptomyces sp. NPDC021098]|uniref:hypothetical protein n=1 Tax=unclassified Streptomyces TaxID=2593676 RepID=UPI0037A927E4
MSPHTDPTAGPSSTTDAGDDGGHTARTDQAAADLAVSSAEHLAGILAEGMLDAVGQPAKLARLLFPDGDPDLVDAVFKLGVATGYRGGLLAGRPRWAAEELDRAREALEGAGFAAMAALVARTAGTVRPRAVDPHPADAPEAAARGAHQ